MKNIILILIFIFSSTLSFSQDYKIPKLNYYFPTTFYWKDTITENQKEYWDNGNIKVEYENLQNGLKLKKEYFYKGRLKLSIEVIQKYSIDTAMQFDEYGDIISKEIMKGYKDVNNGKYIEYHEPYYSKEDLPKTYGQYKNDIQIGLWQTEKGTGGNIIEANFNLNGKLAGQYKEYYQEYPNKKYSIKWLGNYDFINVTILKRNYPGNKDKYSHITYMQIRRIGEWKLFDRDGTLLETVTYDRGN